MRLYNAKDIAARYGVSEHTARRYMHQMGCMSKPLRVSDSKLMAWEKLRESPPVDYVEAMKKAARREGLLIRQKVRNRLENR